MRTEKGEKPEGMIGNGEKRRETPFPAFPSFPALISYTRPSLICMGTTGKEAVPDVPERPVDAVKLTTTTFYYLRIDP